MNKVNDLSKGTENGGVKQFWPLLVIAIFAAVAIFLIVDMVGFSKKAEQVQGEVHSVERVEDNQDVYVNFNYNGTEYEDVRLNKSSSSQTFYEGKKLTLYVDPDDLSDVRPDKFSTKILIWCSVCFALVILMLCAFLSNALGLANKKRQKYIDNGKTIIATIDEIVVNNAIEDNGKKLCYLKCSYLDRDTQILHVFKSHKIWSTGGLNAQAGDSVKVYIMNENYNDYYVDIEALQESIITNYTRA